MPIQGAGISNGSFSKGDREVIKITVLNDNRSNDEYLHEHGLSFYIKTDTNRGILFDTGPSDIFLKNAKTL